MPLAGLEPALRCQKQILNLPRLPIPPQRQAILVYGSYRFSTTYHSLDALLSRCTPPVLGRVCPTLLVH
jgi:hypothetical protein